MTNSSWQVLRNGDQDELTLAVDFTSTGRTQACFRDLVPHLSFPGDVWETVAPAGDAVDAMTGSDYVDQWFAGVRGRTVRTVLGYCVGAVFAAPLAQRLGQVQEQAPTLIILDPELPNTLGLYRDFHAAGDALRVILSEAELAEFHAAGVRIREEHGYEAVSRIGPALAEVFRAATFTAAQRLELDDDIRDELGGAFASFVGYLRAAQEIDPSPLWTQAGAVTSSHSPERAQSFAREIRLDVDHDQMLRHADVGRAVSELAAAGGTGLQKAG